MPLSFASVGEKRIISKIDGKDEVVSHLNHLGFLEGECINIVTKLGGNMIIEVKGTRIALDAKLVSKIYIEREKRI